MEPCLQCMLLWLLPCTSMRCVMVFITHVVTVTECFGNDDNTHDAAVAAARTAAMQCNEVCCSVSYRTSHRHDISTPSNDDDTNHCEGVEQSTMPKQQSCHLPAFCVWPPELPSGTTPALPSSSLQHQHCLCQMHVHVWQLTGNNHNRA